MTASVRVLVVEDNRDSADCMALLLRHFGGEVHVAYESAAAIQTAMSVKPNLMLIDLGLPGIDGLALARELRQKAEFSKTFMAAVTGYGDHDHRQLASQAGFDEYLLKPVDLERLKKLLVRAENDGFCPHHIEE